MKTSKAAQSTNQPTKPVISLDRLTICFNDPNPANVKGTCGLLLNSMYNKQIAGMRVTKNARYTVRCQIPLPFDGSEKHPVFLEAGPLHEIHPSYRLDFNPSKLTSEGISDLKVLLDTIMDAPPLEFFRSGRVTRADVACDLLGYSVDDVIVRSKRKQKHGVYSDRYGVPQTVYLGTPQSSRTVAYSKPTADGQLSLRLECRPKPNCYGYELAALKSPLAHVELLPVTILDTVCTGVPSSVLADVMRIRGIKGALASFDRDTQKRINHALSSSASILPDGVALWERWPEALIRVGLGAELGAQ